MKTVKRIGVFETNSSSIHTMILVKRDFYEEDLRKEKPRYRKYEVIKSKEDKLYMACGCAWELFVPEKNYLNGLFGDKEEFLANKQLMAEGVDVFLTQDDVSYEMAMQFIVTAYCEATNNNYESTLEKLDKKNRTGRACHMKFFEEGALLEYDYELINDLFYGDVSEICAAIRAYFSDDNVLCYREFWNGLGYGLDDDDE